MAETTLTLYEINKQAYAQQGELDPIYQGQRINRIALTMMENRRKRKYWMLLCKERVDYTVFYVEDARELLDIRDELEVVLRNRGKLCGFEDLGNDSYEIWVLDEKGEAFMYLLFDYTEGVIEC